MGGPRMALVSMSMAGLLGWAIVSAQSYPHAFPRDGVVKLFENERVTIWEVNWKRGVPQPMHRHISDMAGAYLRYGPVAVTTIEQEAAGKPLPPAVPFDVPRPYFGLKGVTHREVDNGGPGDPERLAIMVDLREGYVPTPFAPKAGLEPAFPRVGAKDVLDNERVRIWDYSWPPARPLAQHVHDKDSVEIFFEGGTIVSKSADGREDRKTWAFKSARFVPRGLVDTEEAVFGTPRAMIIELK